MSERFQFAPAWARVALGLNGTASVMSVGLFTQKLGFVTRPRRRSPGSPTATSCRTP